MEDEVRVRVEVLEVRKMCPKCKDGMMESCGGIARLTSPPQYPHACTKCGHSVYYSGITYPYTEYKETITPLKEKP